ncbi:MAG: hypothetical protein UV78_C0077G0001 [Parcubacteria group bacterium GW2011_GWA2_43_17]|nr:MAG: hypothetical protein UV78_C0077G0001 [Parcubacteria group bacterium GW2011_GWA2_43_17]
MRGYVPIVFRVRGRARAGGMKIRRKNLPLINQYFAPRLIDQTVRVRVLGPMPAVHLSDNVSGHHIIFIFLAQSLEKGEGP